MKILARDNHRNGVCGVPFDVYIAEEDEGGQKRKMLIVRFDKAADKLAGGVLCAAFDLAKLAEGNIAFFENSWRGDHYADDLTRCKMPEKAQWEERRAARRTAAEATEMPHA